MRAVRILAITSMLGLIVACGQDRLHEDRHPFIYERIFDRAPPEGVEVVHSLLQEYRWRLGVVTTDGWEIEVLAPRDWIDDRIRLLHLAPVERDGFARSHVLERKKDPGRPWYAPRAFGEYEAYYLQPTSIPYVHMLVEKEAQPDGRFRAFLSKH